MISNGSANTAKRCSQLNILGENMSKKFTRGLWKRDMTVLNVKSHFLLKRALRFTSVVFTKISNSLAKSVEFNVLQSKAWKSTKRLFMKVQIANSAKNVTNLFNIKLHFGITWLQLILIKLGLVKFVQNLLHLKRL